MDFDFSIFIGRFHPLFVHLPIGIIIITLIMELIGKSGKTTLSWMWFFSFATAMFSIFTGYQLTLGSSYPDDAIFWHKWLGVAVASTSCMLWLLTKYSDKSKNLFTTIFKLALVVILSIGGHLGGQLTHGDTYLVEAAPQFVKSIAGYKVPEPIDLSAIPSDSIGAYHNLIYPILEQKCIQCHNEKSASGNLDMTSEVTMIEGGDGGEVIVSGDALESELFKRVTLNQNSVKFMPTKGTPMNYYEMELLKWWLNAGGDFQAKAAELEMSKDVIQGINKMYKVDFSPRPWYEKEEGPVIDSTILSTFASKGFKVNDLSSSDNYLEIGINGAQLNSDADFSALSENIIILDLKNSEIPKESYNQFSLLKNLIRLQLNGTETNSDDVLNINPLPRLESINLFGTKVDDRILDHLAQFPSLKRIYTWQTGITEEGIAQLATKRPDLKVENGFN